MSPFRVKTAPVKCLTTLVMIIFFYVQPAQAISVKDAISTSIDAYIYGYPLITFDMARMQETNVTNADEEHAPMGQLIKMRRFLDVDNHCCAAPNADTLYTMSWLDVEEEPYLLSLPDMGERYYIFPMLDGYSEVFKVISSLINGKGPHQLLLSGPNWNGQVPDGYTKVSSPTALIWLLGRIYCTRTQDDYETVGALQDEITIMPLSSLGSKYTAPQGVVDTSFDMKTAVRKQVNAMDIETYFDYLARLMKTNPPKAEDKEIVERMAQIGLIPGQDFNKKELGFIDSSLLNTVPKLAQLEMGLHLKHQKTTNGWLYFTEGVGNFGTDYLLRGMANLLGPGWNRPVDAVYPLSLKDSNGDKYNGNKHNYTIHFNKGELPPVEGFWSLTIYDDKLFFVPNKIDRYKLSPSDNYITNPDGSVDFYLQAEPPEKSKQPNWLPAPNGEFSLILRVYGPTKTSPSILDGSWTPPPVVKVEK